MIEAQTTEDGSDATRAEHDPTRREVLSWAWLASLGTLAAGGTAVTYRMIRPDPERANPKLHALGPIETLPGPGEAPKVFGRQRFWWVHLDRGALALHVVCTRLGCIYDWKPNSQQFICPCFGSTYAPDGRYVQGPGGQRVPTREGLRALKDPSGQILARFPNHGRREGMVPGARGLDRFEIRAYDADDELVARTADDGRPVPIPPGSRVVVDASIYILGPQA